LTDPAELDVGAAIPAYRNVESLRRCLDSIVRVSPALSERISVVDDSGDGRLDSALRSQYSRIRWTVHETNMGFGASANDAVAACTADVVVLLNDDTVLLSDPIVALRDAFRDPRLFAVTFQSLHADFSFREGAKRLVWRFGMPRVLHNARDQVTSMSHRISSAYAVGGHAAFDRKRFLALGGFDPLFAPFYWEDVDVCYRARKLGWETVYLPECRVVHDHESAIRSSFEETLISETKWRNRFLFAWRHASTLQRSLLELSLLYHRVQSPLIRRAFHSANERRREEIAATWSVS